MPHAHSKALLLHGHAGCSNRHKHVVTMAAAAVATCTWHAGSTKQYNKSYSYAESVVAVAEVVAVTLYWPP